MIVRKELVQPDTQLAQIIDALTLLRPALSTVQRRKQERHKNPDYGNDDQKFNQRERRPNSWS